MERKSNFNPEAAARINELMKPKWEAEARGRAEWELKKEEKQKRVERELEMAFQKRVDALVKAERNKQKKNMEGIISRLGPEYGVECLRKFWEGGLADPAIKSYKLIWRVEGGPRCMKVVDVPQPDWKVPEPEIVCIHSPSSIYTKHHFSS